MNRKFRVGACALVACAALGQAGAQEVSQVVVTGKRAHRISKGATGLPLEIKDTPQSISTIDQEEMADFGVTSSNEALRMGTGINVEQYETNRAVFNARGFEIQLTQIDGLGMTNDWGTVSGQLDTFLFERIELIRGANGLLTGVGNSSGTINYVRKRPLNKDAGSAQLSAGSHDLRRAAVDYNKVLTQDGAWAGRLVVAGEDKDSHLRALHDRNTTLYGVIDGQVGDQGVLTVGFTYQDARQKSPMWGSLTLNHADGSQADFPRSSSTSQDWTYWNTKSQSAFVEYTHSLGADWEAKATYSRYRGEEDTRLFYAFSSTGTLNPDNTGLLGWPYRSTVTKENDLLDLNVSGRFSAWGRKHSLIAGISHARQENASDVYNYDTGTYQFLPLPAFPYEGDAYPEPEWGPRTPSTSGRQALTRLYGAVRLGLGERLKGILGVNAVQLDRQGASIYGSGGDVDSDEGKVSPYLGLTYDITPDVLGYVSYSDIFQNQDQTDFDGHALAPMKGVNAEAGVKAEWLDKKLLTTLALFTARQNGLATQGAGLNGAGNFWYEPKDVKSRGVEFEATGRIGPDTRLTVGMTRLQLTGPDGKDIYEWVPRTTLNLRAESRVPGLPGLRAGVGGRWQSDVSRNGGPRQGAYLLANAFAAYELTEAATLRLNVNNLFDRKYIGGLAYGAIYGAPRSASLTLEYRI